MSDLTRQQLCAFWPAGICTERQEITPRLHWGSVSVFKPDTHRNEINPLPHSSLGRSAGTLQHPCGSAEVA